MSTSPSRAVSRVTRDKESAAPEPFPYDTVHPRASGALSGFTDSEENADTARETRARAEGRLEGEAQSRKKFEEQLAKERKAITASIEQFACDRAAYFQKVEAEVVQLALSIARKIIHRESQIDPLLLAGMVRVALENIEATTGVTLRIHPQNVAPWTRFFNTQTELRTQPKIVEDSSQPADTCRLETSMGAALLGTEVQLKEIEQGFIDLLAARPGATR